jgi:hypothetical protein
MTRNTGRHRFSRRTKLAAGSTALALTVGMAVVIATTGDPGTAKADGADASQYVDITTVQPNVDEVRPGRRASTGTFTVNCGRNENGHFNPDNFIAQPGVKNGAQHLHDYVGNLSTNADSTNESLAAAGTTCANGDKSTYFWPVVRILDEEAPEEEAPVEEAPEEEAPEGEAPEAITCPDVASQLEEVPDQALAEVEQNLEQLDTQVDEANQRLVTSAGEGGDAFVDNAILGPLADKRTAAINRILTAMGRFLGNRPELPVDELAPCALSPEGDANRNLDTTDDGQQDPEAENPPAGEDAENELPGNEGEIQRPTVVDLTFRGSPVGNVRAMPKFLRVLYGDAKPSTNGLGNTRASFTCSGFEDRLIDKYPICPEGSSVMRVHDFASCWDGKNTDSANHRTHIVYPDENGQCKRGFKAVPQLRISLTYDIPTEVQQQRRYVIDSFPEEEHDPLSDHDDFANVMSQKIMNRVVNCINRDKVCKE